MKIRSMLLVTLLLSYIWASEGVAEDLTKVIENRFFLFKVPIEMQEVEVQGIDSFVKRYESDTIMLSFDYGWYSNNFSGWPENTTFEEVEIGGKLARIGTVKYQFRDGFPYATQVHFKLDDDVKLSMFAACKTVVDVAIAHGIFGTIVFKDKSLAIDERSPNMRLKHIDAAGREVVIKESGDISALKSAASAYPRGNSELIIWQSGPSGGSAFDIPADAPAICTFSDGSKFIIG